MTTPPPDPHRPHKMRADLKHTNNRLAYVDAFWQVVNWRVVADRYDAAMRRATRHAGDVAEAQVLALAALERAEAGGEPGPVGGAGAFYASAGGGDGDAGGEPGDAGQDATPPDADEFDSEPERHDQRDDSAAAADAGAGGELEQEL